MIGSRSVLLRRLRSTEMRAEQSQMVARRSFCLGRGPSRNITDFTVRLFCSLAEEKSADWRVWTGRRVWNQAVARGIIIRNILVACLGTASDLSAARRLLRKRCQERVKRVRGQTGRVSQWRAE